MWCHSWSFKKAGMTVLGGQVGMRACLPGGEIYITRNIPYLLFHEGAETNQVWSRL